MRTDLKRERNQTTASQVSRWNKDSNELLEGATLAQVRSVSRLIRAEAPFPGSLVCLQARGFNVEFNGLRPVVFFGMDLNTQILVAQAYRVMTTAAAASFVEFLEKSLPFTIARIAVTDFVPSHRGESNAQQIDLKVVTDRWGRTHYSVPAGTRDMLRSIMSSVAFGVILGRSGMWTSAQDLQHDLIRFLFYHNNYRPLPWLGGKTPIQMLKRLRTCAHIHTFDPFAHNSARSLF